MQLTISQKNFTHPVDEESGDGEDEDENGGTDDEQSMLASATDRQVLGYRIRSELPGFNLQLTFVELTIGSIPIGTKMTCTASSDDPSMFQGDPKYRPILVLVSGRDVCSTLKSRQDSGIYETIGGKDLAVLNEHGEYS